MASVQESVSRALRESIQANGGLLGKKEIGQRLGVSRQRVGQLIEDHKDFPAPVGTVSGIPVWLGSDVDAWARRRHERLRKRRQRGTAAARHATLRGSQS